MGLLDIVQWCSGDVSGWSQHQLEKLSWHIGGIDLTEALEGGCCCPGFGVQELPVASPPLEEMVVLVELQRKKLWKRWVDCVVSGWATRSWVSFPPEWPCDSHTDSVHFVGSCKAQGQGKATRRVNSETVSLQIARAYEWGILGKRESADRSYKACCVVWGQLTVSYLQEGCLPSSSTVRCPSASFYKMLGCIFEHLHLSLALLGEEYSEEYFWSLYILQITEMRESESLFFQSSQNLGG